MPCRYQKCCRSSGWYWWKGSWKVTRTCSLGQVQRVPFRTWCASRYGGPIPPCAADTDDHHSQAARDDVHWRNQGTEPQSLDPVHRADECVAPAVRPSELRQAPRTENLDWILEAVSRTETFAFPLATCRLRPGRLVEMCTIDVPWRWRTWSQATGISGGELVQLPGVWNSWSKPASEKKNLCFNALELRRFNLPAQAHNERPAKNGEGRASATCHLAIRGRRCMWHFGRRGARCSRQCLHCLLLADLRRLAMAGKSWTAQQELQQLPEKARNSTNGSKRNLPLVPSRPARCSVGKLWPKRVSFLVGHTQCPKPFWRGAGSQPNSIHSRPKTQLLCVRPLSLLPPWDGQVAGGWMSSFGKWLYVGKQCGWPPWTIVDPVAHMVWGKPCERPYLLHHQSESWLARPKHVPKRAMEQGAHHNGFVLLFPKLGITTRLWRWWSYQPCSSDLQKYERMPAPHVWVWCLAGSHLRRTGRHSWPCCSPWIQGVGDAELQKPQGLLSTHAQRAQSGSYFFWTQSRFGEFPRGSTFPEPAEPFGSNQRGLGWKDQSNKQKMRTATGHS